MQSTLLHKIKIDIKDVKIRLDIIAHTIKGTAHNITTAQVAEIQIVVRSLESFTISTP